LPGLSKTSWAGTLLKLNWVPSKGLLTFCKFWGNRRCVALSEFSLIPGKTHNIYRVTFIVLSQTDWAQCWADESKLFYEHRKLSENSLPV
jgi:hypothetical protein